MRDMRKDADVAPALLAVAVDKDKGSQVALKWAIDNLLSKGQSLMLVHVKNKAHNGTNEQYAKELFLPYRCFCTRKEIHCKDVILEEADIAKAVVEFCSSNTIEKLVVGAATRGGFARFKTTDVPTSISKGAPDFCTVYVISKGKVSSVRNAVRQAPMISSIRSQLQAQPPPVAKPEFPTVPLRNFARGNGVLPMSADSTPQYRFEERDSIRSPFSRGARGPTGRSYGEISLPDTDISFVSSGRTSTDRMFPSMYDDFDNQSLRPPRLSTGSDGTFDRSFEMVRSPTHGLDAQSSIMDYSFSQESSSSWSSSQNMDDVEAEMKRLRLELKQTMDMYSAACREALSAKQKANDLHSWKMDKERRLEEARLAEESAIAMAEREKVKCKAAIEAAEAAQKIAELESQKRINAEMKARREAEERKKAMSALSHTDNRYRKYSIEEIEVATEYFDQSRKIGEGGYGPVYKCYLDHTPVAVKVLRPDAAQGRSQFNQEIEVLSCMRHPNMVLLLGACPEYGCLVYEYLANGSLEDRLFRRGNTPVLPWQYRFRIAAEIATGLLFLHQTKPEPLVHRDLKPANILLDRNYVSKIADVGLARLVPPNIAEDVTQYRMTSAAGTFCYIDPEYQQTGMLGIKSDIYSLGIMLLQIITSKPPMGLAHHMDYAIEKGTFHEMLDPAVQDWPMEDALSFAKLSIKCAELRRKDRPDLGTVVLPELNRLRMLAEENTPYGGMIMGSCNTSPLHSHASMSQETMSDFMSDSHTSSSSALGRRSGLHSLC